MPKYMFMEARPVVLGALEAVEARRVVYVPGLWNKFVVGLLKAVPQSVGAALVARQARRFRVASKG